MWTSDEGQISDFSYRSNIFHIFDYNNAIVVAGLPIPQLFDKLAFFPC